MGCVCALYSVRHVVSRDSLNPKKWSRSSDMNLLEWRKTSVQMVDVNFTATPASKPISYPLLWDLRSARTRRDHLPEGSRWVESQMIHPGIIVLAHKSLWETGDFLPLRCPRLFGATTQHILATQLTSFQCIDWEPIAILPIQLYTSPRIAFLEGHVTPDSQ